MAGLARARVMTASLLTEALMGCQPAAEPELSPTRESSMGSGDASSPGESETDMVSDSGSESETGETGEPELWRSALYPEDWAPGLVDAEGRFLHDFSWAGYHNGEFEPPMAVTGVELSVLDHGADPTGETDSTVAIQATIDAVAQAGGGVVHLPSGSYRCDDLLSVTTSGLVIRGDGPESTFLWFTRTEGMTGKDHLSVRGAISGGAELPLIVDGEPSSTQVWIAVDAELAPGDSVALGWVITDEFVAEHAMTGTWMAFNGQWRPLFRREVEAVECGAEGCRVTLDVPLRYPALVRDQASLRIESGYLSEVGVEDLAVSTVVDYDLAWTIDRSHAIALIGVADGWIRRVHSFESPNSSDDRQRHLQSNGLFVLDSKRITISESVMARPQNRGGGGNGYLFEISRSSEILTRDCEGYEGRHNFIQNWDFGTSGCVWLRIHSEGGVIYMDSSESLGFAASSEFHHSLAMANLIDDSVLEDGWNAVNRQGFSSGAGHSATQNVIWNAIGGGTIRSFQFGWGYVIGTDGLTVRRLLSEGELFDSLDTQPEDWLEGEDLGATLTPASLYEDQLARRIGASTVGSRR